ncbi:MAG: hypothetical protein IRZ26_06895 [Clostridia bacterium]|nr:hypothetical protein [Clostridia bacterium]
MRAAVTALLELAGALPEGEEEPAGVAAAERAAALAAVFAGLNAMDRWFALAPLAGRLVRLWKEVSAAVEAAASAVLPAAVRAPLLVAGVPFDVVDPRGAAYRALLERQLGESPAGRRDAVGLALEAWALLCAGRPEAAEERRVRLTELEPAGEEGLAALALALVAERARSRGGLCP